jgi:hypothetical protein
LGENGSKVHEISFYYFLQISKTKKLNSLKKKLRSVANSANSYRLKILAITLVINSSAHSGKIHKQLMFLQTSEGSANIYGLRGMDAHKNTVIASRTSLHKINVSLSHTPPRPMPAIIFSHAGYGTPTLSMINRCSTTRACFITNNSRPQVPNLQTFKRHLVGINNFILFLVVFLFRIIFISWHVILVFQLE